MASDQSYFSEFKLSVTQALKHQLTARFDEMSVAPLDEPHLADVEQLPGVYELFRQGSLVYIGKADSLPDRLRDHLRKIAGRRNIHTGEMGFRCLYVEEDLSTVAPERMLIDEYRRRSLQTGAPSGTAPERLWNTIGFGNKDPGRNRDRSMVAASHFDRLFPINLSHKVRISIDSLRNARQLASALKEALPYNFRFDLAIPEVPVVIEAPDENHALTARSAFERLAATLPKGWCITALPGYVICYKDDPTSYASRLESWVSTGAQSAIHDVPDVALSATSVPTVEDTADGLTPELSFRVSE